MKNDSHLVSYDYPVLEGSRVKTLCKKQIKKAIWEKGDTDVRLNDLRSLVTCRKCRKAEDPHRRYNYAAIEAMTEER